MHIINSSLMKTPITNTPKDLYQYTCLLSPLFQLCFNERWTLSCKELTPAEHLEPPKDVLKRIHVKHPKYRFLHSFLGHRIDAECIHPFDDKLQARRQLLHMSRSCARSLDYYGKFIQTILGPLNHMLHNDPKRNGLKSANTVLMKPRKSSPCPTSWFTTTQPCQSGF